MSIFKNTQIYFTKMTWKLVYTGYMDYFLGCLPTNMCKTPSLTNAVVRTVIMPKDV